MMRIAHGTTRRTCGSGRPMPLHGTTQRWEPASHGKPADGSTLHDMNRELSVVLASDDVGPPSRRRDLAVSMQFITSCKLRGFMSHGDSASSAVVTEELSSKVSGTAPRAVGLPTCGGKPRWIVVPALPASSQ